MSLRQSSLLSAFDRRTAAVTIVSLAAVMATYLFTNAWKTIHAGEPPGPKTLEVQGQATRHIQPEEVTWTITVHGRDDNDGKAMAKLRENVRSVHSYLRSHGINAEAELSFATPSTTDASESTTYDENGNEITKPTSAWDATQDITVTVKDITRGVSAHENAAIADALPDSDVAEVMCTANVDDAAKEALMSQARRNVRARAKMALDQYGGATLGHLANASIGSIEIGSECAGITMTATAFASYELE